MGVIATSVTSIGVAAALGSVAVFAAGLVGCGSSGRTAKPAAPQIASVHLRTPVVAGPAAPSPYAVPTHALRVRSSRELVAALANGRREAIVLAPGTYDNPRPFSNRDGDQLFAARLGRAVLRAGLVLGANQGPPGALVRGIRFDVGDPAKTLHGAIVHVWGSARHATVEDSWFDGHGRVAAAIVVRQPEGFVGKRLVATSFRSYGVAVDPNVFGYRARSPFLLSDVAVSRVRRPVAGSSNGTAEACVWLGSTGTVRRVSVRRCGVTGIWTGTAMHASRVEDVTADETRVGIYIEHFTTGTTFRRLRIGPHVRRGINAEWANHALGSRPASVENTIDDAYVRSTWVGVYLDEGTTRMVVRRSKFAGQAWAAIGDYRGVDNRYYDNDFSGIAPGAVAVSLEHDAGGAGR
jgi:hypothetical protein